jgi:hypothetical protein
VLSRDRLCAREFVSAVLGSSQGMFRRKGNKGRDDRRSYVGSPA